MGLHRMQQLRARDQRQDQSIPTVQSRPDRQSSAAARLFEAVNVSQMSAEWEWKAILQERLCFQV